MSFFHVSKSHFQACAVPTSRQEPLGTFALFEFLFYLFYSIPHIYDLATVIRFHVYLMQNTPSKSTDRNSLLNFKTCIKSLLQIWHPTIWAHETKSNRHETKSNVHIVTVDVSGHSRKLFT